MSDKELAAAIQTDLESFAGKWGQNETIGNEEPTTAFCDVLLRGGKRLRGVLAMRSYYAHGGTNDKVALGAARIFEIIQASLLIVDDIADRSRLRRGGPSAHVMLQDVAKRQNLKGDALRYGEVQAMNIAYAGPPQSVIELLDLPVEAETARRAARYLNQNIIVTIHGQIDDVFNEVTREDLSEESVESVLKRKTARYTFVSPLELGAHLAGAQGISTELAEYADHAGCAYQIADDIISTFSEVTGKGDDDDIREGKITLLALHALKNASARQQGTLRAVLGNSEATHEQCDEVRSIFTQTGALDYAKSRQEFHETAARNALSRDKTTNADFIQYLEKLTDRLVGRTS